MKGILIDRGNGVATLVRSGLDTPSEKPLTHDEILINELYSKVLKLEAKNKELLEDKEKRTIFIDKLEQEMCNQDSKIAELEARLFISTMPRDNEERTTNVDINTYCPKCKGAGHYQIDNQHTKPCECNHLYKLLND